ncbi:hypothetical protein A4X06_0g7271 [Tilletia controversa]|uniref:FeS cluster biogenesis domain-containing protein n=1 Tax=Tilletia controversa TaxID=13291 RepID=A0A8X7MMH7_9BASI|nr:hypothetical protein A4X06_0g7271 [Tilletia controversa]
MFAPTRAALTATASACLALRPATVVVVGVGARCLSSAAVATTTTTTSSSTSGSASSNTSPLLARVRARVPPSLPNTAPTRRRALHTTPAVLFDAHSLDATAGEEGARVGAVLTAFRRPGLGDGDGDGWRGRDPTIVLTRRAVERLQAIAGSSTSSPGPAGEGREERLALRLAVEPGGCHGYQYKIELVDEADEDDLYVPLTLPSPSPFLP